MGVIAGLGGLLGVGMGLRGKKKWGVRVVVFSTLFWICLGGMVMGRLWGVGRRVEGIRAVVEDSVR